MGINSIKKNKNYDYIWIDKNINNSENNEYSKLLSKSYSNISFFNNIKDAMKHLEKIKFNLTYIIISGSLFIDYISELKNIENKISTSPRVIIFTSESTKEKIKNMKEINDSFYNIGGLVITFEEVQFFLNKNIFGKELNLIKGLRREKIQTGGDFSFQLIENKSDLIGPVYLSDLIMKPYRLEYEVFDKYLIDNYGDTMNELISQIYKVDCPDSLRIKYWLRAYTLETKFYKDLNSDLMKDQTKLYLPYITLLYYGLTNNFINANISNDLYRGALINKEEIENLINHINKKNSDISYALIYCKSFMSFSLDKNVALDFMQSKNPNEKIIRVLYILKSEPGINYKNATNADLTGISYFEDEREILLFPFSVYEINEVRKKDNYYEIYLNYLGKYKELFQFKNETDLYNSIFKSKFITELELAGLSTPIWLCKKSLCRIESINNFDKTYGSGFCCLIPLADKKMKIPVLITSNHIFKLESLKNEAQILISYDDNKENIIMKISNNSKIYTNMEDDITIFELEKNSNTFGRMIFMEIDEDIFNIKDLLLEKFYKKRAYILQYAKHNYSNKETEKSGYITKKNLEEFTKDKNYKIEEGRIIVHENQNEYYIKHNIPTSSGASGGPIISYDKFKVIGVHRGRLKSESSSDYNGIGLFLKSGIQEFIKKFYS